MDYTSIPLPKILAERVKQAGPKEGYRTVTEFVIDATRRRLDELSD
jgi:metal-responsive CopG/Arc/MetJ family transcriptional regulator